MSQNGKARFFNFVKLTVRIGTEPELRSGPSGQPWAKARVSLSMGKESDSKTFKPSLWLTAKAFSQKGDISLPNALAALSKGALVTLSGRLAYEEYETKGGDKRTDLSLLVNQIELVENGAQSEPTAASVPAATRDSEFDPPEDIPF